MTNTWLAQKAFPEEGAFLEGSLKEGRTAQIKLFGGFEEEKHRRNLTVDRTLF